MERSGTRNNIGLSTTYVRSGPPYQLMLATLSDQLEDPYVVKTMSTLTGLQDRCPLASSEPRSVRQKKKKCPYTKLPNKPFSNSCCSQLPTARGCTLAYELRARTADAGTNGHAKFKCTLRKRAWWHNAIASSNKRRGKALEHGHRPFTIS